MTEDIITVGISMRRIRVRVKKKFIGENRDRQNQHGFDNHGRRYWFGFELHGFKRRNGVWNIFETLNSECNK